MTYPPKKSQRWVCSTCLAHMRPWAKFPAPRPPTTDTWANKCRSNDRSTNRHSATIKVLLWAKILYWVKNMWMINGKVACCKRFKKKWYSVDKGKNMQWCLNCLPDIRFNLRISNRRKNRFYMLFDMKYTSRKWSSKSC